MNVPEGLYYTDQHEWLRVEGDAAVVGITDYAQDALGDVVFVDLPPVGKVLKQGQEACAVESSKAASDIYAPAGGRVVEANQAVAANPALLNEDPYGKGWIFKLALADKADLAKLLDAKAYAALVAKEA